ncbi:MAG: hypothetical protein A4E72_01620 [Syntrophus sp. PtaU1.Bin208]|nr:MAG: hypothetical protein A4E72_01620 [Syntrophus sp. PtaU1.Bin208]
MQGLTTGYWHRNGLELYRYVQEKPTRIAGGPLENLKPFRGVLQKMVLIVGRDRLLHVRKRYPPAPKEKLLKAVHMELGELFPFSQPSCYCRIYASFAAYTEMDIWAWESEPYPLLRKILPFSYAIPEDAAFFSSTNEVFLWACEGVTHCLAVAERRFLRAVSQPADSFGEEELERFLNSMDPYGVEIHRLRIYGTLPFSLKAKPTLYAENESDRGYPPCLENIPALDLREFRVRGETRFPVYPGLLFRIAIYGILGYGLVLYLTMQNYEQSISDLRQISRQMDQRILLTENRQGAPVIDYAAIQKELNDKLIARPSPVSVLDMLARTLPKGSYVSSVQLNEKNLDVWILSREPLAVLKALTEQKGIRNLQLKGPLNMEGKTGEYSFNVTIEISR